MNKRILICGDRYWTNKKLISDIVERISSQNNIEVVIEGEARGADTLGREVAESLFINVLKFPAQWDKFGRSAGPKRNQQMLDEGKPNMVLAFHKNLDESKGTKDMVNRALKARLEVWIIDENQITIKKP